MTRDLARLLAPRSIAVFGGGWAVNVIEQCRRMGFAGPIWPVHPEKAEVCGLPAFPSVADLPAAPDAAFVGVNRHASIEIVRALAGRGAGGAVAFAAGWAEAAAADLQAELVAAAGAMPLLGPNCYGLLNYLDGAAIWPDQHGGRRVDRGVAILSQSSNVAINLTMQRRGLPLAVVGCLGNAAQTGLVELGRALLADSRVTALGAHVEGIADAPGFVAVAEAARAAGKGVVVLKAGRSAAGARAAASHTAALAGQGAVSSAFLAQCGVAEVATLEELVETLKILHVHGPLTGRRLASLSCSGGEAGLVADLAAGLPLDLAPPSPATAARLAQLLGPLVTVANPLDYHTFIWGNEDATAEVFTTMLADHDAGLFVIDLPRADRCDPAGYDPALNAIARAARATGRPAFACATLPENLPEPLAETLMAEGIVPLMGLGTGLAALAAVATPAGRPDWRPLPARAEAAAVLLDEAAAKALLAGEGIAVPRGVTAPSLPELIPLAAALTPPLALKGLGFLHKTEAGAVRLNVSPADLAAAAPMPGATGYLVEEMVTGTVAELILGVRRDPVYGATLTLGFGGTAAELLADTVTLVLPVSGEEVAAALGRLRLAPLLAGHRGRPRADTAAAVDVALRLAGLMATRPEIVEIEINPLIVRTAGAVAADALVRLEEP
jgi:acyl-CoA synthetase (NDP forming)